MMKKFAVLPLAALAFAAACSDTSQNPLAAPDQAPQLSLATPGGAFGIHTLSAALQANGSYNVTVGWNALAGATSYESKLVRCQGSDAECGRSADAGTAQQYIHTGVTSNSGRVKARVIANLTQGKERTVWCTLTLATNEVVCASTGGGDGGGSDTNNAPEAWLALANVYAADEGDQLTFSGTVTDADAGAALAITWTITDGTNVVATHSPAGTVASGTSVSWTHRFGDNLPATAQVILHVSDGIDSDSDAATLTISNVDPTNEANSWAFNPYTGVATATINFRDKGWLDKVTPAFSWSSAATPSFIQGTKDDSPALTGEFTSTHTFGSTCNASAVTVQVSDDDGGLFDHEFQAAGTVGRYTVGFLSPIKADMRNVVKHGNVIPVKVSVRDCNGNAVPNQVLKISLSQSSASDVQSGATADVAVTSVSSADTSGQLRMVDGHYMYNMDTKPLTVDLPYTVVIKHGNDVIATATIQAKK